MSVSDNSTVAVSRDNEASYQLLDGIAYGVGDLAVTSYEKSPYADAQMVSLDVGPDATRFEIHGTILCQSVELAAKVDPWNLKQQPVPLPELDEAAAHTLVHYLYTGKYQALTMRTQPDKAVNISYKLGTCVYCAAVRYKLPGLAELAKEKITSFGEDVSIFDVLALARDHAFPMLPENDTWYAAYLEGAINSAMADDTEPFRRSDFITRVAGNSRLLQFVWKTVTSNFARTTVAPKPAEDKAVALTADMIPDNVGPIVAHNPGSFSEPPNLGSEQLEPIDTVVPTPAPVGAKTPPRIPVEEVTAESEATREDCLKLDDIEPTLATPQPPEPFTDELGFESSRMYRQTGKKSCIVADVEIMSEDPEKSDHTRSDSVMQVVEQAVSMADVERKADEAAEVVEDSAPSLHEASNCATNSKKSKKQKKRKSSIVFH